MKKVELSGPEYLSDEERRELLNIARKTIEEYIGRGKMPAFQVKSEKLNTPGAAFVTIEIGGKLRGCIGNTKAVYPLFRTVMECAVSAATEDPRFPSLSPEEIENIDLEISVLTPLRKVEEVASIQVGRHGLMVSRGAQRGLLLPQVAVSNGWDREAFLSQTCLKAGLSPNEWREGADIFFFEAEIFNEEKYR